MEVIVESPIGKLGLHTDDISVIGLSFKSPSTNATETNDPLCEAFIEQLNTYFNNPTATFALPTNPAGTTFQKVVWRTLQMIPVGETRTYGELAKQLNTSPRAIGNACRANPIPVVIPCHRVVGSDGRLTGYTGQTEGDPLAIKRWLIDHESTKK